MFGRAQHAQRYMVMMCNLCQCVFVLSVDAYFTLHVQVLICRGLGQMLTCQSACPGPDLAGPRSQATPVCIAHTRQVHQWAHAQATEGGLC